MVCRFLEGEYEYEDAEYEYDYDDDAEYEYKYDDDAEYKYGYEYQDVGNPDLTKIDIYIENQEAILYKQTQAKYVKPELK